jgi:hypothetical protein
VLHFYLAKAGPTRRLCLWSAALTHEIRSASTICGRASLQRIQDALATGNDIGVESNVPQGGVVWVFAVKK